jgi:hypothetical protein
MSALLGLTSADSAEVREDAVAGLARVGGADGHTALLGILRNDPDVDVRRVALEVLVAAPGAQDDEALREALGSAAKSDDSAIREDANWGMRVLLEEIPEPPTTDAAREVRRLLGASLEWLLRDLDDDSRTTLLAGGAPAAEAAGACLAKIAAAGGRYPGYAFALVRLVGRFGSDTARSALSELAGGTTALAAAARARSG